MRSILLCGLMIIPNIQAAEAPAADSSSTSSVLTYISDCLTSRWLGYTALAALGVYGLYRLALYITYQEEGRLFQEHPQDPESFAVSKRDAGHIHALIDAMEQDIEHFQEQPERVNALLFDDFDDHETANGCEGVRSAFCVLYEQSVQHPENKPFLYEFVMIFRQAIEDAMVIA